MKCHYEILEVSRTASALDIKKAYRRLALLHHPDKHPTNIEEQTIIFAVIQEAHEVLSDIGDKKWYDMHREEILRGPIDMNSTSSSLFMSTSSLLPYFSASCLTKSDFISVYGALFERILEEERLNFENDSDCLIDMYLDESVSLGFLQDEYEDIKGFYNTFMLFSSCKSFNWCDQHSTLDKADRIGRRTAGILYVNSREEEQETEGSRKERI